MLRASPFLAMFLALSAYACRSGVPHPAAASHPASAFVEVDYPPPPAHVEFVPVQPANLARWVNGEWLWTGQRWAWKQGAWMVPPEGAGFAKATLFRRTDGKLLFAPGAWRNARGEEIGGAEGENSDGGVTGEGTPNDDLPSDAGAPGDGSAYDRPIFDGGKDGMAPG
jgi:hypothetical protein